MRKNVRKPTRSYRKKTTGFKRKSVKPPTGVFKKKVLSIIKSEQEDKSTTLFPDPRTINPILATVNDLTPIFPPITQGTANNQRIGDAVRGKTLTIRGHLELATSAQNSDGGTRVIVRLMVLTDKLNNGYQSPATNPPVGFLQNLIDLGASNTQIDGSVGGSTNLRSMYFPINRNAATVHYDKLIYLNAPRIINNTALQLQNVNYENTVKLFNIRLKVNKVFKYTDSSTYPQNCAPYLCAAFFQLNGGANSSAYVRLHHTVSFTYEDN